MTQFDISQLEKDEYYQINGTVKVLFWDGNKWMKPVKDRLGKYGYLAPLDNQPVRIKSAERVVVSKFGGTFVAP